MTRHSIPDTLDRVDVHPAPPGARERSAAVNVILVSALILIRGWPKPADPSRAAAKRQPFETPMALQTQLVLLLGRAELAASLNACQGLLEKLHRLALFLGRHPARVKFEPEMW